MFNAKAQELVACWYCDHFQRYDRYAGTDQASGSCVGECRANRAPNWGTGFFSAQPFYLFNSFPVIDNAQARRCGQFQRTREKNLPPPPPVDENNDCADTTDPLNQQKVFNGEPWNKKILTGYVDSPQKGICCWNCDHFFLWFSEDPQSTSGECVADPPAFMSRPFGLGSNGAVNSAFFWTDFAVCLWCARWERARHDLPALDWQGLCETQIIKNVPRGRPGVTQLKGEEK